MANDNSSPSDLNARIYRYVLRTDAGTAPNPFEGWCTLAICKPRIRRHSRLRDWIIGFRSGDPDRVAYVMQIEKKILFADYWNDLDFACRKPDATAFTDNFYRPRVPQALEVDDFEHINNCVHKPGTAGTKERDLSGRYALVSQCYWYFGEDAQMLPKALTHLRPVSQSGNVIREVWKPRGPDPASEIATLRRWLNGIGPAGQYGLPRDLINDAMRAELPKRAHRHPIDKAPPRTRTSCE